MAKKNQDWELAKLLFEQGKSLGEIEKSTGINKGSVSREAKKCNWEKSFLQPIEEGMARVVEEFATLTQPQQVIVANNVEKKLKAKGLIKQTSMALIQRIADLIPTEMEMKQLKAGADALNVAMKTTGVVDYYPAQKGAVELVAEATQKTVVFEVVRPK